MKEGISKHKTLLILLGVGALIRLFFMLIGAQYFYGRENIHVDGDTYTWLRSIQNLIEHGVYTLNLNKVDGEFARMPGYSFFIGIFYLLSGKHEALTFKLVAWAQFCLDLLAIAMVYQIARRTFRSSKTAFLAGLLYATYPFIIVWNPVVYAESFSIFLMIACIWFFTHRSLTYHYWLSGICLSVAMMCRPQIALLVPFLAVAIYLQYRASFKQVLINCLKFGIPVILIYGSWPLRNYLNHDKLIFTRYVHSIVVWDTDIMAYWDYIFHLKAEWEPQFTQILTNKKVDIPAHAYTVPGDSAKLAEAIALCRTCGRGFRSWPMFWDKSPFTGEYCNDKIIQLFGELKANQLKHNPWQVWVKIPLKNLQKSFFKSTLYEEASLVRKMASLLFLYRTLLIFMGLAGSYLLLRQRLTQNYLEVTIALFFVCWYWYMAFIWRNIEMRYYLPIDILLLLPAAYLLGHIMDWWGKRKRLNIEQGLTI